MKRALLGRGVGARAPITGSEPVLGVDKIKMEKTETPSHEAGQPENTEFIYFFFFLERSFASKRLQSLPVKFWNFVVSRLWIQKSCL